MASSSTSMYLSVDFHYNGMFSPNLLVCIDPVKTSVCDVDFGDLQRKACVRVLEESTVMLVIGSLRKIVYSLKRYESDELDEEDDKDSKLSETMEYEHECDEEVHTFDKTVGDPFLDKL
uniref:Uncharacterized protein n=1 Tax=Lactuca sativa TaxID=4236 RepID=A0A9R1UT22_LACSA|nr:hypothetical protein LSAT_V11C800395310 [Lactuca sativa]